MKFAFLQQTVTVAKGKISFATISYIAKEIFLFATVSDGFEDTNFIGFCDEYGIRDTTFCKLSHNKFKFIEKFHEINFFVSISYGCKGENSLCNHDSGLQSRYN